MSALLGLIKRESIKDDHTRHTSSETRDYGYFDGFLTLLVNDYV